jgi:hypothetical protein
MSRPRTEVLACQTIARADIVRDIVQIVYQVANGMAPGPPDPLDDDMPGG